MEEIIRTIDGEYDDWVSLQRLDAQTTTIADTVQTISCDTRDFALGWNFNQPERYEDDSCGLKHRSNEGLAHMAELMAKGDMQPYVIEQQAAPMVLTNPYAHLYDAPKPKPVYYDGPCCQRCKNRFRSSQFCADHHQEQRCYRFKLDK